MKLELLSLTENEDGSADLDVMGYAESRGEIIRNEDGLIINYIPKNPGLITLIVIDHIGLINYNNHKDLKEAIDKVSRTLVFFRNMFNYSPVVISQINRGSENMERRENDNWMPMLSDIKNTGNIAEDANTVIGIASPFYYGVDKCLGYDITKYKNRYRLAKICKNRDGDVNKIASFLFIGEIGGYYQLPKAEELQGNKPEELAKIDKYYFNQKQQYIEAISRYNEYRSVVHRSKALPEIVSEIKRMVEFASKNMVEESGDWFEGVSHRRNSKRLKESVTEFQKISEKIVKLQRNLESIYENIGKQLGSFYEIKNR